MRMAFYETDPTTFPNYRTATLSSHLHPNSSSNTFFANSDVMDKIEDTSSPKVDPSYKSKRYRDKLRSEIRDLENLLPVERSSMQRKLDSQTVFRLAIAYFRTKLFIKVPLPEYEGSNSPSAAAAGLSAPFLSQPKAQVKAEISPGSISEAASEILERVEGNHLLQVLDGFLLVVTSDGTVLYVSENIAQSLGFTQVELLERCIYGIVHPDDHHELKMVLEHTLDSSGIVLNNQRPCCQMQQSDHPMCKSVSFLTRIKCFSGATTGYLKMHCTGHMRSLPNAIRSAHCSGHVLFALCRPFVLVSTDPTTNTRNCGFWSKHSLDLRFRHMDDKIADTLGYSVAQLEGTSFYSLIHPEDLSVFSSCHRTLIHTEEIQTMYFRVECKDTRWIWLHTRGKVVFKNSKKYSIVFTHCPVRVDFLRDIREEKLEWASDLDMYCLLVCCREEDSTYIQQEMALRRTFAIHDLMTQGAAATFTDGSYIGFESHYRAHNAQTGKNYPFLPADSGMCSDSLATCPSSWHTKRDCQSPLVANTSLQRSEPPQKQMRTDNREEHCSQYRQSHFSEQANYIPHSSLSHHTQPPRGGPGIPCEINPSHSVARFQTRQYLMQLNGVGMVTPQNVAKTLVFQGHLTAIETEIPPIWSPPLWSDSYQYDHQPITTTFDQGPVGHASKQLVRSGQSSVAYSGAPQRKPCQYQGDSKTNIKQETCQSYSPEVGQLTHSPFNTSISASNDCCRVSCQEADVMSLPSCAYQSRRCHYPGDVLCRDKLAARTLRGKTELPNIGSFLDVIV